MYLPSLCRVWMRQNRFQLNPAKTEWPWLFVHRESGMFPSCVLDGTALPHSRQVCNLGAFLLEEQVAAVVIFCTGSSVCQLCPSGPSDSYSCLSHLVTGLLKCGAASLQRYGQCPLSLDSKKHLRSSFGIRSAVDLFVGALI